MFCLRSWLPLLFIPTNASPMFIFLFFVCTYFLNRPCVYCSFLLLILFASSCHWSDHCFFDFSSNWFQPRHISSSPYLHNSSASADMSTGPYNWTASDGAASDFNYTSEYLSMVLGTFNQTAVAIAGNALDEARKRIVENSNRPEWTGLGVEWLRSLLGRREWRVPCVDVYIRL